MSTDFCCHFADKTIDECHTRPVVMTNTILAVRL